MAIPGFITKASTRSVAGTMDRLEVVLREKGIHVFVRIDQQAEAVKVGLTMPAMELLIFGNPKGGTPLMIAQPEIGIDLPLKALAWEDPQGKVWLGWNSPEYLRDRFSMDVSAISGIGGLMELALAQ
jgi:uncharacterized protein (DUF302 family)